jgi:hypothetical protein
MKAWIIFMLSVGIACLLAGCLSGPGVPKGDRTIQGRGLEELAERGDPYMETGEYARKVPKDFAAGYTKGESDQVKRAYWAQQQGQQERSDDVEGRLRYYNATIPERVDSHGVRRVEREVIIPIVE